MAELCQRIGFIGTFPPTQCGLASFTDSLVQSMRHCCSYVDPVVVRLVESGDPTRGAGSANVEWMTDDPSSIDHVRMAMQGCDAIILQHEYGIYGGQDGEGILDLLRTTTTPKVVVLHTVLAHPSPHQQAVLEEIVDLADVTVIQSQAALSWLRRSYTISDPTRIVCIPHGAWIRPGRGTQLRQLYREAPVVLSWGLIGPGKGLEHGIEAVARLGDMGTPSTYLIAGETHPKVRELHGEQYREALRLRARQLGLSDSVILDDRYRDAMALAALIWDADVVLLPYESREQVTSGVLVEAIAAGKPVVATRFPHAVEILDSGAGLLVDHGDIAAMAEALSCILTKPALRDAMANRAERVSTGWHWSAVADGYLKEVGRLIASRRAA